MASESKYSTEILPGTAVEVRKWDEISSTLDAAGRLNGLPFMPEMLQFCGRRFTVRKKLERTCEEVGGGMRRIRNVVFLDELRCDGSAHGGCQKGCMIFWRDEWLQPVAIQGPSRPGGDPDVGGSMLQTEQNGRYSCQSTELPHATEPISPLDFRVYLRDVKAGTYSPLEVGRNIAYAAYLRMRHFATGVSYKVLEGSLAATPIEELNLQAGEYVRVKSKEEISATLDRSGKNRGLAFTVEMIPFCGREFRVLRRVERAIHEPTRRLIRLDNTVILDGVTCDGCHILRGGCPKETFHFWREVWLTRVS